MHLLTNDLRRLCFSALGESRRWLGLGILYEHLYIKQLKCKIIHKQKAHSVVGCSLLYTTVL